MNTAFYVKNLTGKFSAKADPERSLQMSKYMKNLFDYYGIQATRRREISRNFMREEEIPLKNELFDILKELWSVPQRECQYFGMELAARFTKETEKEDLKIYEWMILDKSWWDTVDFIAANLVGSYFLHFPEKTKPEMSKWLNSGNIWLQRATLIFQLKYKEKTDTELLSNHIYALREHPDFFIRKAIGWSLREYGKTNPGWVIEFVDRNELSPLSKREALKRLMVN
jgi:3-methyladenine DNA glycosylase AlkD